MESTELAGKPPPSGGGGGVSAETEPQLSLQPTLGHCGTHKKNSKNKLKIGS